jgi:hypothetical protein
MRCTVPNADAVQAGCFEHADAIRQRGSDGIFDIRGYLGPTEHFSLALGSR